MNTRQLTDAIGKADKIVKKLIPLSKHSHHLNNTLGHVRNLSHMLMDFEPTHGEHESIKIDQKQFVMSFRQLETCRNDIHAIQPMPHILSECKGDIEHLYTFYEKNLYNIRHSGHSVIHDRQGNLLGHSPHPHKETYNVGRELEGSEHSHQKPPPVPPKKHQHDSHGTSHHDSSHHHGSGKKPVPAPRTVHNTHEKPPPLPTKKGKRK